VPVFIGLLGPCYAAKTPQAHLGNGRHAALQSDEELNWSTFVQVSIDDEVGAARTNVARPPYETHALLAQANNVNWQGQVEALRLPPFGNSRKCHISSI
jgi:hypothetical protein